MATLPRLNQDNDMIQRMEVSLAEYASLSMQTAEVTSSVYGVFSLDDLENKLVSDLCNHIGVGVGYAGAERAKAESKGPGGQAPGGREAVMLEFVFQVILAVPIGADCIERYNATKLLTVLRRGIHGKTVAGDATNRAWEFVKEFPNVVESTKDIAFYSQVWTLRQPGVGFN